MEIESLKFLVERCHAESMVGRIDSSPLALHYAELIALVFLRELSVPLDETRGAMRRRLGQLWDAVDADLKKPWSVGRLAAMAHVSTSYLHKLTARHYGARPMDMVLRLRMQQAEALLIHTDLAQENIAEEIGYGTAYSFSHAFLRHAGVRPGTFRLRFLESRN